MTREMLEEKMKDLPNPPCRVNLIQQVWEIMNSENEELETQIEKMKCCENCKHHCFWGNELNCKTLSYDEELECMKTKNKWELDD